MVIITNIYKELILTSLIMTCRDMCTQYKALRPTTGVGRYFSGQKRCQICDIFIKWEGFCCPCCGYKLRSKPKKLKYKNKLREKLQLQVQLIPISN